MKNKYILKITLKSDMCAGSGYSYAGIIDNDVCYDEFGLPYIPARRIKGCLRECSKMIGTDSDNVESIYGKSGQSDYDSLENIRISDAFMEGYRDIISSLKELKARKQYAPFVSIQNILDQYTNVKAQTRIGTTGGAENNTLRFTRCINHYSPDRKEMVFFSDMLIEDKYKNDVARAVKALRHMGVNRNRGLGNVKCELLESESSTNGKQDKTWMKCLCDDDMCELSYVVETESPVVISQNNDAVSETYMNGQSVLGVFAGEYIKSGKSADTAEFEDIFLTNKVVFGPLYPYKNNRIYYPAPSYISRLKKTKCYVNNTARYDEKDEQKAKEKAEEKTKEKADLYNPGDGNQPKKLKGKYVSVDEKRKVDVHEVETQIIYHHRKEQEKNGVEGILYTLEAICSRQQFAGKICGKYAYVKELIPLMEKGVLYFGKSKGAQYGRCAIINPTIDKIENKTKVYEKGQRILISLKSDALFMDHAGYTVDINKVKKSIAEKLGIPYNESEDTYSEIEVKAITGFYGKWNLKRQAVPGVCAGSSFEYILTEPFEQKSDDVYVGCSNGLGYGLCSIMDNTNKEWVMESMDSQEERKKDHSFETVQSVAVIRLCRNSILDYADERIKQNRNKKRNKLNISKTALGRLTLMLTQSINMHPGNADERYKDLIQRVESIKDTEKRNVIAEFIKNIIGPYEVKKDEGGRISDISCQFTGIIDEAKTLREEHAESEQADSDNRLVTLYNQLDPKQEDFEIQIKNRWDQYFMHLLIQLKYDKKYDGKGENN